MRFLVQVGKAYDALRLNNNFQDVIELRKFGWKEVEKEQLKLQQKLLIGFGGRCGYSGRNSRGL